MKATGCRSEQSLQFQLSCVRVKSNASMEYNSNISLLPLFVAYMYTGGKNRQLYSTALQINISTRLVHECND